MKSRQDINAMELNYDQLSDFDLLQIYQSIFIETNIVPYNTGLNIINYTLYKKVCFSSFFFFF